MPRHSHGKDKVTVLHIDWDVEAVFLSRPNRFVGIVDIGGKEEKVHVHDPGRLEELLYPGNRVLLKRAEKPGRKTRWDLIASWYEGQWVFTNSGYHRQISENIVRRLFSGEIKAEVTVGHSRLDFVVKDGENITGIEVKGCTLTENGVALFPDAPTERGRKHLETLISMMKEGKKAVLLILVFRKDSRCFAPNERTDPKFAETFGRAVEKGLMVRPVLLEYDGRDVWWKGEIGLCSEG